MQILSINILFGKYAGDTCTVLSVRYRVRLQSGHFEPLVLFTFVTELEVIAF